MKCYPVCYPLIYSTLNLETLPSAIYLFEHITITKIFSDDLFLHKNNKYNG